MFSSSLTDRFAYRLAKWNLNMVPLMVKFLMNYFQFSYKMHELERNNKIYLPEKSKTGCSGNFLSRVFSVRKFIELTISQSCFILINLYFSEKNKNIYH